MRGGRVMDVDRIEELLSELYAETCWSMVSRGSNRPEEHAKRATELRHQIADEYRALLAALALALEWLDPVCEEDYELGGEPEGIDAKRKILAAIDAARGEVGG